jgi:hypothetical protein
MVQIKVYYDQPGNTLIVWFGNPQDEYVCDPIFAQKTQESIL